MKLFNNNVRSAWEIDADKLTFKGNRWAGFLDNVVSNIKPDLGLEDYTISAHLYKMLIYETGDFFLPNKDSEKEKGMFGTLVIGLPSKHTGGLKVYFGSSVGKASRFLSGGSWVQVPAGSQSLWKQVLFLWPLHKSYFRRNSINNMELLTILYKE